jgi:hypothetical protein
VTALVIGIPLAVFIWSTASRLAAGAPVREHGALSRVTLLHAGLVFGTAASLASTAYLLQQGLLVVTGGSANAGPAWSNLITPLACLPVSLVGWLAFASAARHTVVLSQAAPGAVAVRRSTFYLLAAAGLVTFSFGMALLWRVILSGVAGSPVGRFSLGAALVLVGAPAWWGYWWPRQVRARQAGVQGIDERNSVARKTYLYGIIGAMAVVLVLPLVAFALQGGKGSVAAAVAGTTGALAAGGIALFWLITHLLVMRGDRRWRAADRPEPAAAPPPEVAALPAQPALAGAALTAGARSFRREDLAALAASAAFAAPVKYTRRAVVVVDGGNGGLGASLLAALHNALPETPLWPVGLNPGAQAAMLAALGDAAPSTVPSDALARASAILGPTDLLLPGGLGGEVDAQLLADLASSPARLILLPPRDPRLRWVAAPEWPDERWVENAVIEVSNVG